MFRRYQFLTLVAGVCLLFLPATAMAWGNQSQGSSSAGSQPQISDTELQKAATAYQQIMKIQERFEHALQQKKKAADRKQLRKATNEKMLHAVKNAGLNVRTYNRIMRQIRTNKEMRQEFVKIMRQSRQRGQQRAQ